MSGKLFDDAPIGQMGSFTYYPLTGATSVSGPDSQGLILSCTPSPSTVLVWINGQKVPYGDLTVTQSSVAITGYTFTAGDVLEVIAFTVVALANIFYAAKTDQQTPVSTSLIVTPGQQQSHPSAAKAWCIFDGTVGSPVASAAYNVASISKSAAGVYTVNFTVPFASINFAAIGSVQPGTGAAQILRANPASASSVAIVTVSSAFATTDAQVISLACYGAQ